MAALADTYIGQIYKKAGFFAPWFPNIEVGLGAIGVLEGGVFKAKSTLKKEAIPWEASEPGSAAPFELVSERGVEVRMKAEAEVVAASFLKVGEAGALISFTKRGATVLHATGVRERHIENRADVEEAVLAAFEKRKWKKEWLFVDEIYVAERATVLVSEGTDVKVELRAKVPVAAEVPLAAGFELAGSSGSYFRMIGDQKMTVMFHLSRVTQSWIDGLTRRKPSVGGVRRAAPRPETVGPRPAPGEPVFESVPYTPDLTMLGD